MNLTREQEREIIELNVLRDYQNVVGRVLVVEYLKGYAENGYDGEFDFSENPIVVRVVHTPESDICRWMDEWCDPTWNVKPLEIREGMEGFHGWEVYGNSYSFGQRVLPTKYRRATLLEKGQVYLGFREVAR